jgi:hypothetical protein
MIMFNWYQKLSAFLSPSIVSNAAPSYFSGAFGSTQQQASAADIAAELAKINPTLIKGTPRSTGYKVNPFTQQQLAQFAPQQGLLSAQNPIYQQYLNKMAGYGAGAGKTSPAISAPTTQGNNNG